MTRLILLGIAVYLLLVGIGFLPGGGGRQNPLFIVLGIVFLILSNVVRRRRPPRPGPRGGTEGVEIPEEQLQQIRALVGGGRKMEAAERYRELTGVDITLAQAYVEGLGSEVGGTAPDPISATYDYSLPLPKELEGAIQTIAESNQGEAIRRVRELTGVGLAEARHYVESLKPH